MTKSTITREQLEEWVAQFDEDGGCDATDRQLEALIRQSLAAMDSDPVAVVEPSDYVTAAQLVGDGPARKAVHELYEGALRIGDKLYRHAQPALVVPPEQHWEELCRQHPDMSIGDAIIRAAWWNHCRAAMLQASPVCTCPSGDGSLRWPCPVHADNSPTQSDCFPAQNHVSPEQNSVAPAQSPIDHGYRPECKCSGCKTTSRICAELSANSPANPNCWCRTCRPVVLNDMRFVACPDCGNKRCPRANDHRNSCTGSNEPGQEGSAYPDTTQEPKP